MKNGPLKGSSTAASRQQKAPSKAAPFERHSTTTSRGPQQAPDELKDDEFFLKFKGGSGNEARILVASLRDTTEAFLKDVGPHPGGQDVALQGFWYTVGGSSSNVIFDMSTGESSWKDMRSRLKGAREVQAEWWVHEDEPDE